MFIDGHTHYPEYKNKKKKGTESTYTYIAKNGQETTKKKCIESTHHIKDVRYQRSLLSLDFQHGK